jgi:hypothetical protein
MPVLLGGLDTDRQTKEGLKVSVQQRNGMNPF